MPRDASSPKLIPRRIHIIGICGRGTAALAIALAKRGVHVTGTDEGASPPMSTRLAETGIKCYKRPSPRHLQGVDAVIVGGATLASHPEVRSAMDRGMPLWHFAAFLGEFLLKGRRNIVIAGSKGKTTTTAMTAWIGETAGKNPDYLIGGVPLDLPDLARFNGSEWCVLEGDEFWTGYWDVRPKFLHYQAEVAVVTNVIHDHPEVYADARAYGFSFSHLVDMLPKRGTLILNADDRGSDRLAKRTRAKVVRVGFSSLADHRITKVRKRPQGSRFEFLGHTFEIPLGGRMNVRNAAMAAFAARAMGVSPSRAARALSSFHGVEGRQEVLHATKDLILIKDTASQVLAYESVLEAVQARFPGRRIVIQLRLQSGGPPGAAGGDALARALRRAGLALVARAPQTHRRYAPSGASLKSGLEAAGVPCRFANGPCEFLPRLPDLLRRGDVLLLCPYQGDFDVTRQYHDAIRAMKTGRLRANSIA